MIKFSQLVPNCCAGGLGFDSQNDQHRGELAAFAMISTNGLSRKNYYDGDDDDDDDDDDESKETIKENLGVDIGDLICSL
ncbi:hypothetical protein ACROYT_G041153 [Oculina patagonica]